MGKLYIFAWKVANDRVPTAMSLRKRKVSGGDLVYIICKNRAEEDINHILIECKLDNNIWVWISNTLHLNTTSFLNAREPLLFAINLM